MLRLAGSLIHREQQQPQGPLELGEAQYTSLLSFPSGWPVRTTTFSMLAAEGESVSQRFLTQVLEWVTATPRY